MKVYAEDTGLNCEEPKSFVLILNKREAQTLLEIVEAAQEANKRKSTFRAWRKKLEDRLCCF